MNSVIMYLFIPQNSNGCMKHLIQLKSDTSVEDTGGARGVGPPPLIKTN